MAAWPPPRPPPPALPRTRWSATCSGLPDFQGEVLGHRLADGGRRRAAARFDAKTRAATAWFSACRWSCVLAPKGRDSMARQHERRRGSTFALLAVTGSGVQVVRGDRPAVAARRVARGLTEISSFQIRTGCSDAKYSSFACSSSHCDLRSSRLSHQSPLIEAACSLKSEV